jgi:hypothetical protein
VIITSPESRPQICTDLYTDSPILRFLRFWRSIKSVTYVFSVGLSGSIPTRASRIQTRKTSSVFGPKNVAYDPSNMFRSARSRRGL